MEKNAYYWEGFEAYHPKMPLDCPYPKDSQEYFDFMKGVYAAHDDWDND
jgi:hypothetical protein